MPQNQLYEYLAPTMVEQFRYFDTIGSTNDEALNWVETGAPDYALVLANEQTKGRGRFERKWVSRPGVSLAFSLILTPSEAEKTSITLFSPLCGLAVHQAVKKNLGVSPDIKWPNDVLLNGRKFAGILVEAAWTKEEVKGIVLGIGINISPEAIPPEHVQLYPTTSLESETGKKIDRFDLLKSILLSIQDWRSKIGSQEFFDTWQDNLAYRNKWVRIEHSEKASIIGKVKGIDERGNLVLLVEGGKEVSVEVGDVHLRRNTDLLTGGNHA